MQAVREPIPLLPLPTDWSRALVAVAHPDDVEWGMSAAVSSWTRSGRTVTYVLASRGEAGIDDLEPEAAAVVRENEQRQAAMAVGVDDLRFLARADGHIEQDLELRRDLAEVIRRTRPELVVTLNPYERWSDEPGAAWNHPDHRAVGAATIDAVHDAATRWAFPDLLVAGHEPWAGTRWIALAAPPRATHAVQVTNDVDAAIASLAAHDQYLTALHPHKPAIASAREIVDRLPQDATGPFVAFELLPGPAAR